MSKETLIHLYTDAKNQKYYIVSDIERNLYLTHWSSLMHQGITNLNAPSLLEQSKIHAFPSEERIFSNIYINKGKREKISNDALEHFGFIFHKDQDINLEYFLKAVTNTQTSHVFINCNFKEIELSGIKFSVQIIALNCTFKENFRLIDCHFDNSLWFCGSRFKKHFSLKNSKISGSIHLESASLLGLGGASFRGVYAKNIFIDFGFQGGNDPIWLNEMQVEDSVSIGGNFSNSIEIKSSQSNASLQKTCNIGQLLIGCEPTDIESFNSTKIESTLIIHGAKFTKNIHIENTVATKVSLMDINAKKFRAKDIEVSNDFLLSKSDLYTAEVLSSYIGRRLLIKQNKIIEKISFSNTSASESLQYIDNQHSAQAKININQFSAPTANFHPTNILYENSKFKVLYPPEFSRVSSKASEIANNYCNLKNWFSNTGKLKEEDMAFYYMMHHSEKNLLKRFLFGVLFGWGVRLTNIIFTIIVLNFIFSVLYKLISPNISWFESITMSFQSFINAIYGAWPEDTPTSLINWLKTGESFIGIFVITIFVGAYLRKMLR